MDAVTLRALRCCNRSSRLARLPIQAEQYMNFSPKAIVAALALGLCLAASGAYAQEMAPAPASSSTGHMHSGMSHNKMMKHKMNDSMHKMPATVKSVDATTGVVGVETEGMALTLHFPPKSLAGLKVGDKITLHMGFSK
jgi:opacity protein-like surface antigen